MNFLKRAALSILTKAANIDMVNRASLPSGVLEFLARYGKSPDLSPASMVSKYWGWVYACANLSAARFASTPLKLYAARGTGERKVSNFATKSVHPTKAHYLRNKSGVKSLPQVQGAEDFEEITEHPILDLLQKVNDNENGFELKELTSVMLDLTGNGYWYMEMDKTRRPTKLFLLRSQWVRVIPDAHQFISGYWYGHHNSVGYDNRLRLDKNEVIHFKYPNPFDPWYGMGPVQAAAYNIESDEMRQKFIIATMGNMGRPDLIVKYLEGELDMTQRQQVEREWNNILGGPSKAGKVKVTDYRYEMEKVGWNPQELDFSGGEDWIMKRICAAFPVPVGLIDTTQISRAPRAGMEGADLFMATTNTLPRCTRFEEKLNEQLAPLYDDRLFFAFDNPVPRDKQIQLREDQQNLATFVTTVNEVRKREGLDEVEWGDLPLAGPGIAPLGSAQAQPPVAPGPGKLPKAPEAKPTFGKPADEDMGTSIVPVPSKGQEDTKELDLGGIKKCIASGLSLEVDGKHVHPSLNGIPLRIFTRNETGRFDRRGKDKLRATGDDIGALRVMLAKKTYPVYQKFVKKVRGEYCVFSHQTGKSFGCYKTKEEAKARLAQIHQFSK